MDKQWAFSFRLVVLLLVVTGASWLLNSIAWLVGLILISTLFVYILYPFTALPKKTLWIKPWVGYNPGFYHISAVLHFNDQFAHTGYL